MCFSMVKDLLVFPMILDKLMLTHAVMHTHIIEESYNYTSKYAKLTFRVGLLSGCLSNLSWL
jgi:hypothetical protein